MTDAPLTTWRILRLHLQLVLARFDRWIDRAVLLISGLVAVLAQTDNGWAQVFGKWGPLVSVLLVWIAREQAKGRAP